MSISIFDSELIILTRLNEFKCFKFKTGPGLKPLAVNCHLQNVTMARKHQRLGESLRPVSH